MKILDEYIRLKIQHPEGSDLIDKGEGWSCVPRNIWFKQLEDFLLHGTLGHLEYPMKDSMTGRIPDHAGVWTVHVLDPSGVGKILGLIECLGFNLVDVEYEGFEESKIGVYLAVVKHRISAEEEENGN